MSTVQSKQKIVVVGAGVFGAWTAHSLLQSRHSVTLLDEYGPASSRSSSGGETRIIRCSYGPDEIYTHMAKRSLTLWSEFARRTNPNLLQRLGVLWMALPDNKYVEQSRHTLRKVGVSFEDLSTADLKQRYPQIHPVPGTVAIFEPDSGALLARQAAAAVVHDFIQKGGKYFRSAVSSPARSKQLTAVHTSTGESISADVFVFACGAWLGKIFPEVLGDRIFPTMQEVLFFGTPAGSSRFSAPSMPVWIDFSDNREMYGFPDIERRGFKVAFDHHGPPFNPDTDNRFVRPEKVEQARKYVSDRFPELANSPVIESRVCQYENTSNGDFLIDRHPDFDNVWLVGGGSGHGFKHGPAVGEYVAARINNSTTPAVEPRFSLQSKATQQKRAVF